MVPHRCLLWHCISTHRKWVCNRHRIKPARLTKQIFMIQAGLWGEFNITPWYGESWFGSVFSRSFTGRMKLQAQCQMTGAKIGSGPLATSSPSELCTCSDDGPHRALAACFLNWCMAPLSWPGLATSFHSKTTKEVNCLHHSAIEQVHKMFIRCSWGDWMGGQLLGLGLWFTSRGEGSPRRGGVLKNCWHWAFRWTCFGAAPKLLGDRLGYLLGNFCWWLSRLLNILSFFCKPSERFSFSFLWLCV